MRRCEERQKRTDEAIESLESERDSLLKNISSINKDLTTQKVSRCRLLEPEVAVIYMLYIGDDLPSDVTFDTDRKRIPRIAWENFRESLRFLSLVTNFSVHFCHQNFNTLVANERFRPVLFSAQSSK